MIKIIYACNNGYLDCLQLSMLSILRRTKQTIHFYVLTQDFTNLNPNWTALTDSNEKLMKKFVKGFNRKNEFTKIDCAPYYDFFLKGNKNESSVCSPYTNLRLVLDKLPIHGKVLYIDTDVMCCGDIKELDDISLSGKSLGANRDYLAKYWHPNHKKYFNAGVLSVDLEKARETNLFEIARQYIFKRKYKLADQTALNKAAKKTNSYMIFPCGFRYNTQQPKMLPNTMLKHFCATWIKGRWKSIKQTDIESLHTILNIHTFDEDYEIWKKSKI